MDQQNKIYVRVILPLAVPKLYSYEVPEDLIDKIEFGLRVEVPLRSKLYSALVIEKHEAAPRDYLPRQIISVLDEQAIITKTQFSFWEWMADYYCCTIGEVMNVALPSGLKLNSETKLIFNDELDFYQLELNDAEFLLAEALSIQQEITIGQTQDILNKKSVYPHIKSLLEKRILYVKEELRSKFAPKKEQFIRLTEYYQQDKNRLIEALELCKKSEYQQKAILAFQSLTKEANEVPRTALLAIINNKYEVIRALVKKEIFLTEDRVVSRIGSGEVGESKNKSLSDFQQESLKKITDLFKEKDQVLIHGVTGSGKTEVYIELIKQYLKAGKQVLYLLPEIALTTQIVQRISAVFNDQVGVFHSKINNNQRVEQWQACKAGDKSIFLGARSSLFLPFKELGLIIIDEEHDPSYKQNDPNPRYNGRDCAIYLANLSKAKVLMGTATPSIESFFNVEKGKYGLVEMTERFGFVSLPEIHVVDLKKQYKTGRVKDHFSQDLIDAIGSALEKGEQVLLFQNRRGFVPTIRCNTCDWKAMCVNCDVSLTKHRKFAELRCHYCGYRKPVPKTCPACGNHDLVEKGLGTEKIEDIASDLFPQASVQRMDYDTSKTKAAFERIIADFENKKIDILVGTQMITKGLDFDNISVVGILNADLMLMFPDFRAFERSFQLLTQVSGRAGRRQKQGQVYIQTFQPMHPVILDVVSNNYNRLYSREILERKRFIYPPFYRLIQITLRHRKAPLVAEAAKIVAHELRSKLGKRVIGPAPPAVERVRTYFLQVITIKMERNMQKVNAIKQEVLEVKHRLKEANGLKTVRFNIDVDPY